MLQWAKKPGLKFTPISTRYQKNVNLNTGGGFQRTNDRPGQPEESVKPEVNQKQPYLRKLYIMSGPDSQGQ